MYTLQCFNNDIHRSHEWTFLYGEYAETKFCPGRVKVAEGVDDANRDDR